MGITYSFADNTVYGTEDINDITRNLVGAGVAPFVSKDSYNVSDLNVLTSALVGSGVQLEGCKCTVWNKGAQNMAVNIAQGIVFFEGGVRLTVDEDGCTVAVEPNKAGVVYAYYNQALQTADILFADSLPDTGESVCLAEISAQGELTDKRQFARSKIATLGRNVTYNGQLQKVDKYLYGENASTTKVRYVLKEAKAELSKFRYVLVSGQQKPEGRPAHGGVFDIEAKQFLFSHEMLSYNEVRYNTKKLITGANEIEYGFDILNNMLIFYAFCSPENATYIEKNTVYEFDITFV